MLLNFLNNRHNFEMIDVALMLLAYAVVLFLVLPVHEFAHGFVAHLCGDDTAKWHGRLSLNPLHHLDLWGTLMILTVGIGYAKPVPVNPRNLRNYKRDSILVALAGPFSNFLMALLAMLLFKIVAVVGLLDNVVAYMAVSLVIDIIISVNVSLMVFNLLPIPPLDGSRLWSTLLPGRWSYTLEQYSQYITMGLFVLIATGALDKPLFVMRQGAVWLLDTITSLPFMLFS